MSLCVITDSTACLDPQQAQELGIIVVEVPAIPSSEGARQTTTRPTVEEFLNAYQQGLARADSVLSIHLSGLLSGTVENARLAARQLGSERVQVMDSGTIGGGLALAAMAAAGETEERRGLGLAREVCARSTALLAIANLEQMWRGGRIDRATALLGGALGMRPVLEVSNGKLSVAETVSGQARVLRHIVARAVQAAGGTGLSGPRSPSDPVDVLVQHCQAPERAEQVVEQLDEAFDASGAVLRSIAITQASEAVAAHVGEGAISVAVAPALGTSQILQIQ